MMELILLCLMAISFFMACVYSVRVQRCQKLLPDITAATHTRTEVLLTLLFNEGRAVGARVNFAIWLMLWLHFYG